MKKIKLKNRVSVFTLLFSALVLISCNPKKAGSIDSATAESIIRIGVQPNESAKDLTELQNELSRRVGQKIEFVKPHDYSQLVDQFKNQKIDFSFMTALVFIESEQDSGAKALLKKVYGKNEFYYSAIIVKNDSKVKSIKDLKGKRFGFVDPKSTSGYLYPRLMLRASGLDAGEGIEASVVTLGSEFLGTHGKAVQALAEGTVDAVAVWADDPLSKTGAWTDAESSTQPNLKFRAIQYSDPIPNDVFVVREKYYTEHPMIVFKVMEAIIGLSEEPNGLMKRLFDVDRMATATSRHYDSVRSLQALLKETSK